MQEELVRAAIRGDDGAFYQLIIDNKEKLYRIAYSYLKNEADALEAIQEVTCRAFLRIRKLKEEKYFSTWLVRIMINYCIDECKKRNRFSDHPVEYANKNGLHTTGEVIDFERMGIDWALDRIDPKLRTIIELKYFHDLTITEIARTMEKPEGTIKTWLNKGLKGLRSFIHKEGETNV